MNINYTLIAKKKLWKLGGKQQMKPIFEKMPKMNWVMSLDSPEYRFKKRLQKWVKANKKQLQDALDEAEKALQSARGSTRVAWLWQKKLLSELLGER